MGIYDRKDETMKALFSEFLWTGNGLLSESGTETFWDRSTLHAFKGLLAAGATDQTMKYLAYYSSKRLLGDHVPYAVEAWPEGNQRHLSAESGLYCRVITEGLFGIEPVGFREFKLNPQLPEGWNFMKLKNIRAFQSNFDINVLRDKKNTQIQVFENGQLLKEIKWDRKSELVVHLN
jgi:cellobiose phosphorylase